MPGTARPTICGFSFTSFLMLAAGHVSLDHIAADHRGMAGLQLTRHAVTRLDRRQIGHVLAPHREPVRAQVIHPRRTATSGRILVDRDRRGGVGRRAAREPRKRQRGHAGAGQQSSSSKHASHGTARRALRTSATQEVSFGRGLLGNDQAFRSAGQGPWSGRSHCTQNRGAPRVPRGVTSVGGLGAMSRPPCGSEGHLGAPM